MTNDSPGHSGTFSLVTGATKANKVLERLTKKYGEDYDSKPVIIVKSTDAESLKTYIDTLDTLTGEENQYLTDMKDMNDNIIKVETR